MRKLTLILLFILSSSLFAHSAKRVLVYLKDGSVVHGKIVLMEPDKLIKLRTGNDEFRILKYDQIDSIAPSSPDRLLFGTGYFNLTEIGDLASPFYHSGNGSLFSMTSFSAVNVSSWRFPSGLATGIGVGLEAFHETYLPVVADFRYFFRDRGSIPFLSFQSGFSIPVGGSTYTTSSQAKYLGNSYYNNYYGPQPASAKSPLSARGGYLFLPSVGIQIPLTNKTWLSFSAGYHWMRNSYNREDGYELYVDYRRVAIKIGLLLK